MNIISKVIRDINFIRTSKKMLAAVADVDSDSSNLVTDDIERIVDAYPDNLAFIEDDRQWTYREFDAYANKVANWGLSNGIKPGDTVAIFVQNRLEFVALWFGLSKIGCVSALINYQLRSDALAHCVTISQAKLAIVDSELRSSWASASSKMLKNLTAYCAFGKPDTKAKSGETSFENFDTEINAQPSDRPDGHIRDGILASNIFMKMFTSGTTGMPKAAKLTHTRGQYYLRGFAIASGSKPTDRVFMVLPLYHGTGGICGVGLALTVGGAVIVRRKFSATSFWDETVLFKATLFMYVGELCRFLLNAPYNENETTHNLRCIVGNGLRPEVWPKFVERFKIPRVVEFYGATEGNISLINFEGKVGAVGRMPHFLRKKFNGDLIKFDVETNTHIKDADGFCQRTDVDEVGELIGEIRPDEARFRYDGYQDKKASSKKILRDVFTKGDMWFRTGDLLWRDADDYYYFADRIGDTFRWKAENVATNEVAAAVTGFHGVSQANVYGVAVPNYDGKAGMASLVAADDLDLDGLYQHINSALPPFARPVFLRISTQTDTTGTFKYKKTDLMKEGFDPTKVKDKLYMADIKNGKYIKLTPGIFAKIGKGAVKF